MKTFLVLLTIGCVMIFLLRPSVTSEVYDGTRWTHLHSDSEWLSNVPSSDEGVRWRTDFSSSLVYSVVTVLAAAASWIALSSLRQKVSLPRTTLLGYIRYSPWCAVFGSLGIPAFAVGFIMAAISAIRAPKGGANDDIAIACLLAVLCCCCIAAVAFTWREYRHWRAHRERLNAMPDLRPSPRPPGRPIEHAANVIPDHPAHGRN